MLKLRFDHPELAVDETRYLPLRGMAYSLVVHEIVFFALNFLSIPSVPSHKPKPELVAIIDLKKSDTLYLPLPLLGTPSPVEAEPSDEPAPSPARKGLTYPGPQPIVSDFPSPTNRIQTLLRPELKDAPILPPPLSLPNIVQMADLGRPPLTAPALPPLTKPETPKPLEPVASAPAAVVKAPEVPVKPKTPDPAPAPKDVAPPASAAVTPTKPGAPAASASPTPPTVVPVKPNEVLLALSPTPAPREDVVKVPAGEARGRFAVSPNPNLDGAEDEPGLSIPDVRSPQPVSVPKTAAPPPSQPKTEKPASVATPGKSANAGANADRSGAPPNPAAPRNDFPGITIMGAGSLVVNGVEVSSAASNSAPLETSYGLTILSTESSGGSLPQYGVFASDEQIHAVYVDVRRSMFDTLPSWTFQYAVVRPPASENIVSDAAKAQGLVLPFPSAKTLPVVPMEVLKKNLQRMVVVFGVINIEGKLSQLLIKESPDPAVDAPVLAALAKWTFRPAQLDGEAVAVKTLIGIPLSMP